MSMLIADSGSTKTEWALVEEGRVQTLRTAGLNPVHQSAEEIECILCQEFTPPMKGVDTVHFYGAGCIPSVRGAMTEVLRRVFKTENVTVESDLLGAARGVLGRQAGVIGILGTGSNSAIYDGERIVQNVPPLGYILGDEGSGADLGKRLISSLLKGLLPTRIAEAFHEEYPLDDAAIIEAVYRKPAANRFLAAFSPFLARHIDHPAVWTIVEAAFSDFMERNLMQYNAIQDLPIALVGSVACCFEYPLRKISTRYGLIVSKIEQSPLPGLIQYHRP